MSDVTFASASAALPATAPATVPADWISGILARRWLVALAALTLIVPTIGLIARTSWSTEQGAHGPVVLATGAWLVYRMRGLFVPLIARGRLAAAVPMLAAALAIYALGRISGTPEIEGYALYVAMIVLLYAYVGLAAMRMLWFPILYFFFLFPPPDSVVAAITQPLKLGISRIAVNLLDALGSPNGRTGVIITVDQYDILVAAACSGLNSIISLSAIGLFYIYIRHNANWRYAVLLLILITYYFGDAAAQGFLHGFAGMTMFAIALLGIFGIDMMVAPLRRALARRGQG